MYFPSDCDVAAAVRLKCISDNSCVIRRERGTLLMGCHDETKERERQRKTWREREVSEKASECEKEVKRRRKRETEMEPSSRPFTAIISL